MSDIEQSYLETLDFIYAKLPMYSRVGVSAYKKDLTNTLALCDFLGNPQSKFRTVHIGGTNGKGSTTNYLASMAIEDGLKVGIYTSPHLIDFRERIRVGHQMIPKEFVLSFIHKIRPLIEDIEPSFFEITVAMAFDYFASLEVDLAFIEVGLGGRLDSTNIIDPILSLITNVSFDHMNMLGDTLEKIAIEKAGIIKKNRPIIIGETNEEYAFVFDQKAKSEISRIEYADRVVALNQYLDKGYVFKVEDNEIFIPHEIIGPDYQLKNIRTSILGYLKISEILDLKSNLKLSDVIVQGIENRTKNTGFLGRWTLLEKGESRFILESAHNEAGILEFNKSFSHFPDDSFIVFGCVNDKDITKIIQILPSNARYILTQANIPRALNVKNLCQMFEEVGLNVFLVASNVDSAIDEAVLSSKSQETIFIIGSVFVVGEGLHRLQILGYK